MSGQSRFRLYPRLGPPWCAVLSLRAPLPIRDGSRNELEPRLLRLGGDARRLLQDFTLEIERLQASGQELSRITPFASKAAEHAARLAGVLTLYEDLDAAEISEAMMINGIKLARFYINEALRMVDAASVPQ